MNFGIILFDIYHQFIWQCPSAFMVWLIRKIYFLEWKISAVGSLWGTWWDLLMQIIRFMTQKSSKDSQVSFSMILLMSYVSCHCRLLTWSRRLLLTKIDYGLWNLSAMEELQIKRRVTSRWTSMTIRIILKLRNCSVWSWLLI